MAHLSANPFVDTMRADKTEGGKRKKKIGVAEEAIPIAVKNIKLMFFWQAVSCFQNGNLPLDDNNAVFNLCCRLCTAYERKAFIDGLQYGAHLINEILQNACTLTQAKQTGTGCVGLSAV